MDSIITSFNQKFEAVHDRSVAILQIISGNQLFRKPRELERTMTMFSCGEYVLRSAAAVEQTFGGITTRLWDDPFEWTLPEKLSTPSLVVDYLNEVETTRKNAFGFFGSDIDLTKEIQPPSAFAVSSISCWGRSLAQSTFRAEHSLSFRCYPILNFPGSRSFWLRVPAPLQTTTFLHRELFRARIR